MRRRKRQEAARQAKLDAVTDQLLACLERAAGELDAVVVSCKDKVKTESGEETRDYQEIRRGAVGIIDRGGLKQLTGVLKDLKDVLGSEADVREQEARIARLQRDLQKEEAQQITVSMEGESMDYAN